MTIVYPETHPKDSLSQSIYNTSWEPNKKRWVVDDTKFILENAKVELGQLGHVFFRFMMIYVYVCVYVYIYIYIYSIGLGFSTSQVVQDFGHQL